MRRIVAASLILVLALALLAGCGSPKSQPAAPTTAQPAAAAKPVVLKVGASVVPHAEILNFLKPTLAKEGVDLQVVEFTDYVKPNMALAAGELDANFFQHIPYLEDFSAQHNLNLTWTVKVHIEPIGVYSRKLAKLDDIKPGSVVAIPNDVTNAGRALALLAKAGLFTLKDGVGVKATVQDITANPKNLKVKELEAAQLPRSLDDVAAAVINGNYALDAGLTGSKNALFMEGSDSPYANVLAVRKGDENRDAIVKLSKALTSPEVKQFILGKYKGEVVPAF
ncbi:MAG: MetQ/NlpA family ABC transporter substrate-binding protein [Symbiobacteriia bacterium]